MTDIFGMKYVSIANYSCLRKSKKGAYLECSQEQPRDKLGRVQQTVTSSSSEQHLGINIKCQMEFIPENSKLYAGITFSSKNNRLISLNQNHVCR